MILLAWIACIAAVIFLDTFFIGILKNYMLMRCMMVLILAGVVVGFRSVIIKKKIFNFLPLALYLLLLYIHFVVYSENPGIYIAALLNFLIFVVFSLKNLSKSFDPFCDMIKIVSIIGCCSALYLFLKTHLTYSEIRFDTIIDKGYLTLWLSVCFNILFIEIISSKKTIPNALIFVFLLVINLSIVQSKTAFLSFFFFSFVLFFALNEKIRRKFLVFIGICATAYSVGLLFFPEELLPFEIQLAINQVTGHDFFQLKVDPRDLSTYVIRADLTEFCHKLFKEHPLIGIGLGNFKNYAAGYFVVEECESTYADLYVEGGLLYLMSVVSILLYQGSNLVKKIWICRKEKTNLSLPSLKCLAILCAVIICFDKNDFLKPFPFLLMAYNQFMLQNYEK